MDGKWDLAAEVEKAKSEAQVKTLSEPALADAKRKLAEGDFEGCLEIYRKLLTMNAGLFGMRAFGLYGPLRDRESKRAANDWAKELVEKRLAGPDEILAWPLATLAEAIVYRPDPASTPRSDNDDQDFALAIQAAWRANEIARGKDPWRLQTLAKVVHASGDQQRGAELMDRSVQAARDADWGVDEVVKIESMRDRFRAALRKPGE